MNITNSRLRTGVIIVIFMVILVGCIFLFTGKSLVSPPLQNASSDTCSPGQVCLEGNDTILSKDNLSPAQKKLSSDLLQLTDNRFLPSGMTKDTLEQQMEKNHQLMHVADSGATLVYVYIKTSASADNTTIISSVWNVTNSDPANHLLVAWVDVNNLMTIASLESVQSVQTVSPPVVWRG